MIPPGHERRKYDRYATEAKIYFRVTYDLKTKIEFQVVDKEKGRSLSKRHAAVSKNVSAEALCFISKHKLKEGDFLLLEVYLPKGKKPIHMEGRVVWSKAAAPREKMRQLFDAGVRLTTVDGNAVKESIYFDSTHQVMWSVVLESVFGNFRKLAQKTRPA